MRIGFKPPRPSGNDRQSLFLQWVWDSLTRLKFIDSSTVSWDVLTTGIKANSAPPGVAAASSPTQIKALHFKQSFGDYFLTYEGISVAKGYKLRNSIGSQKIYNVTIFYSYPHNLPNDSLAYIYRVASLAGNSNTENEGVVPQFLDNDLIFAVQCDATGVVSQSSDTSQTAGTKVAWLDLNADGRAWTRFSNPAF